MCALCYTVCTNTNESVSHRPYVRELCILAIATRSEQTSVAHSKRVTTRKRPSHSAKRTQNAQCTYAQCALRATRFVHSAQRAMFMHICAWFARACALPRRGVGVCDSLNVRAHVRRAYVRPTRTHTYVCTCAARVAYRTWPTCMYAYVARVHARTYRRGRCRNRGGGLHGSPEGRIGKQSGG